MARPRQFDEATALDQVMLQFWRRGYSSTSIEHLVQATGLGRQSLYNAFGDKHALFLAALKRYKHTIEERLGPLLEESAGLADVRNFVEGTIGWQRRARCTGCLLVRSALEVGSTDAQTRTVVHRCAKRVRAALAHALAGALARGELASDRAPTELAAYVFATLNGIAALVGTGGGKPQVHRVVDVMFEALGHAA